MLNDCQIRLLLLLLFMLVNIYLNRSHFHHVCTSLQMLYLMSKSCRNDYFFFLNLFFLISFTKCKKRSDFPLRHLFRLMFFLQPHLHHQKETLFSVSIYRLIFILLIVFLLVTSNKVLRCLLIA